MTPQTSIIYVFIEVISGLSWVQSWQILINYPRPLKYIFNVLTLQTQHWKSHKGALWLPEEYSLPWWRHQMETFSRLLAFCAGNSPVTGEFPSQRPVTRIFDVFFDLRLNQWLNKQWRHRKFETLSCSLWRHFNAEEFNLHPLLLYSPDISQYNITRYCIQHNNFGGKTSVRLRTP